MGDSEAVESSKKRRRRKRSSKGESADANDDDNGAVDSGGDKAVANSNEDKLDYVVDRNPELPPQEENNKDESSNNAAAANTKKDEQQNDNEEEGGGVDGGETTKKRKRKRNRKKKSTEDNIEGDGANKTPDADLAAKLQSVDHTVFIEGLPFTSTEDEIRSFFAEHDCNDILQLRLPTWQDSGRLVSSPSVLCVYLRLCSIHTYLMLNA